MARTDTLGHFLTDVADAIREKKGSSDTIQASDFDTEITNLPSGGGGNEPICVGIRDVGSDSTVSLSITAPQMNDNNVFSINKNGQEYSGSNANLGSKARIGSYSRNIPSKGLIFALIRSNYTLSQELELLAESSWFEDGGTRQKLIVCWCESDNASISVADASRMEIQYVQLYNAKKPTSTNVILNDVSRYNEGIDTVTPTNKMCIYCSSSIYSLAWYSKTNIPPTNAEIIAYCERLWTFVSLDNTIKTIPRNSTSNAYTAIIGIEIEAE